MVKQSKYVALGAGIGMIFGAALGNAASGLVLGAAAGVLWTAVRPGNSPENRDGDHHFRE